MTHRRRGQHLETALLEAAWAELNERGFATFTLEAVARRAATSTPVIYRRWSTKQELIEAALVHTSSAQPVDIPDTGTLRGDLLAVMRQANERQADLLTKMTVLLGSHFAESGPTPAALREQVLGERRSAAEIILERAIGRGEVDRGSVTPRTISLPFDLFRHEVLTTLQPVPERALAEILDEIVLPLLVLPDGRRQP